MDKDRFFPQIKFFGEDLNEKIINTKVLIVGIGGLGSWLAEIFARWGIKRIGIIDHDKVEISNLSRQNYLEEDLGKKKVECLESRINKVNSAIKVDKYEKINLEYFKDYDIFFDCVDNIETKYLLNEISVYLNKPYIFGTIVGEKGFFGYINPKDFCFYDIFKGKKEVLTNKHIGIEVSSVMFLSSLMAKLFIKTFLDKRSRVFHFNLSDFKIEEIKVNRKECKICIKKEFEYLK